MKYWLLFSLTIVLQNLSAQLVDSLSIKQVDSLIKVSRELTGKNDFQKALEVNAIAEKLALEKFGKESAAYGSCCFNRGRVNSKKGDNQEAEKWYLESKAIREKVLGKEHPDYTSSLNNLAVLYLNIDYYEKAEPLFLESKAIREKVLGKEHPEYTNSLNNLAILYQKMGYYEKAEPLFLESKAIREKVLGKEHPEYANSLNNLAILYRNMGNYQKAEPLFLESKAIREKVLGKEHPYYPSSLNSLANLYSDIGNYEKAERLYLESKDINEKVLGKEHPDYALSLNNLAILYLDMGNYEKAEPLFLESIAIREKVLGKEHPDYASSLNNLANLYRFIGNYEKAERLYLESKNIREKVLGKEHPDYAGILNNLADLYRINGNYEKAEPLFFESKAIREKVLGKEHPEYLKSLMNLAILYNNKGEYKKAENFFAVYAHLNLINILLTFQHLSVQEANQYLKTFIEKEARIFSFSLKTANATDIVRTCFDNTLFYKGFLLNAYNHSKKLILSNSAATEKYNLLMAYSRLLSAEYAKPIVERKGVIELEEKYNALEKELARTVAGYQDAMKQVKWQELQQILKKGEAAIEFVYYGYIDKQKTDSTMYAALLLKPGDLQPEVISLFEEKSLDSLLNNASERKADYVNGLYTLADRGAIAVEAPKKSLYEIVWKPLEKELGGIKTIYFSPTGLLHRINLDAIPISETATLADKYQLIELNSTRQLVIPTQIKIKNNDAVLYGGIQFEQDSILQSEEPIMASRSRGELSFSYIDTTLRGGTWNYLTGTEREVISIEKIMQTAGIQTHLKKGYAATEESFKNIGTNNSPSPRILHIATHGYFFADPKSTTKASGFDNQKESVFKMSDHPMLRSGLIMAGGNAAWQGKQTLEGREDGILTAYEISQMNLSNTELVVLSACETGLGDIQGNEGVYGLQRAFKIAGAKYLIMSLWQVPDKQTSLLMTTFYKKWLEAEMTIPNAFHAAQKELRDLGLDPYQWAGFVLVE